MKRRIINLLLIILLCFNNTVLASTIDFSKDRGILLFEEKSDTILYEQNSENRFYPASTTKIMTALLVLENLNLEDKVTVGNEIAFISADSSKADVKQGEVLTVKELLYGLLVASGNDIALTLGTYVGGKVGNTQDVEESLQVFVEMMNKRAKELGAKDTHFTNPHGLTNVDHYSTPEDMLRFTRELLKSDVVRKIVSTPLYKVDTNLTTHQWKNTNVYLHKTWDVIPHFTAKGVNQYYRSEVTGVKTGFTNAAGRCIVFTAQKDGMDLIGLLYHSEDEVVWQEGLDLMEYAKDNYDYIQLVKKSQEVDKLDVSNNSDISPNTISAVTKENIPLLVEAVNKEDILKTKEIEYNEKIVKQNDDKTYKLKKNVKANQVIGRITYSVKGKLIESNVYSAYDVEKRNFLDFIFHWQLIALAIVLIMFTMSRYRRKMKRRKYKKRKIRRV